VALHNRTALAALLALAFAARALIAWWAADLNPATATIWEYGGIAELSLERGAIVSDATIDGSPYVFPTAFMPPALIFFDMFWFWLLGVGRSALACLIASNVLFGTAICFYTVRIAHTLFGSRPVALLAGLIIALHPVFVFSVSTYHAVNIYILLLLVVFDLLSTRVPRTAGNAALAGLMLGVAMLARTEYMILGSAMMTAAYLARKQIRLLLLAATCAALVVAPWTGRNYLVFHEFIPIVDSAGLNLYKGFNPFANGSGHWIDHSGLINQPVLEIVRNVPLTPRYEIDTENRFKAAALDFIRHNRFRSFVELPLRKILLFWLFDVYDPTTHSVLYQLSLWPVMLLAFVGIVRSVRSISGWDTNLLMIVAFFVAQTAVITGYAVHSRYRMNVEPFLACFAAFGLLLLLRPRDQASSITAIVSSANDRI
jgi:hypothetical protein